MSLSVESCQARVIIFSRDERIGNLYRAFLGAFVARDTHGLEQTPDVADFKNERSIVEKLCAISPSELWNTVCLIDLTQDDSAFDKPTVNVSVWAPALPLVFPEVYWIFVVTPTVLAERLADWGARVWAHQDTPENPGAEARLHFVTPDDPDVMLNLIERHAAGFRTAFDPTFLRRYCRSLVQEAGTDLDAGGVGGHAARPVTGAIGRTLRNRGRELARSAQNVFENLHAALVCLDAWSALQGRPRAASLEALQLLYQAEANAECGFLGASSVLPVDDRLDELGALLDALYLPSTAVRVSPARASPCDVGGAEAEGSQEEKRTTGPDSPQVAICLDDEHDFLILHAYSLYTRGFHVYMVGTWQEMQSLLRKNHDEQQTVTYRRSTASVEDLDLGFEDLPAHERYALPDSPPLKAPEDNRATGLLISGDRSGKHPELVVRTRRAYYHDRKVRVPMFDSDRVGGACIGASSAGSGSSSQENRVLFVSAIPLSEPARHAIENVVSTQAPTAQFVQKPHGGLFDDRIIWVCGNGNPAPHASSWLSRFTRRQFLPTDLPTARGRLLLPDWTSTTTRPRAGRLIYEASTCQAVFQRYNAESEIVDTVRDSYRRFDEFDAEEAALGRIRIARAHAGYYAIRTRHGILKCLRAFLKQVASLYFASNIRSPGRLAAWSALWIFLTATAGWWLEHYCIYDRWCTYASLSEPDTKTEWIMHSMLSFLTNQFDGKKCGQRWTCYLPTTALVGIAYVQLGLLISLIYQAVSRR